MGNLYGNNSQNSSLPQISGLRVSLAKLPKRERARLAANIMDGRVRLYNLTQSQVARIRGVSVTYAIKMRAPAGVVQIAAE
jgi:hypothetical protein